MIHVNPTVFYIVFYIASPTGCPTISCCVQIREVEPLGLEMMAGTQPLASVAQILLFYYHNFLKLSCMVCFIISAY